MVKLIAFYLPQFHPTPENDTWWGKGFTEWMNVTRPHCRSLFKGHYQPRLPGELGFYDLRMPEVRDEQAELARTHGIYGFCYYYYWFGGRRLLYQPFDEMVRLRRPAFPFCVCWANENWTRRWDGGEKEILIAQNHSDEDDRQFIQSLIPALRDERYIRIENKPILLVYRTELLPNPLRTSKIWREEALKAEIGEIYLIRCESFYTCDPHEIGFDASYEFPPHGISPDSMVKSSLEFYEPFYGEVFDYKKIVRSIDNGAPPAYKRFRGLMVSWDNTARRGNRAHVFTNSLPEHYKEWLSKCIADTKKRFHPDEQLVFINAWNEWAEGCYLEPDQRFGRAFLAATRTALLENGEEALAQETTIPAVYDVVPRHVLEKNLMLIKAYEQTVEFLIKENEKLRNIR